MTDSHPLAVHQPHHGGAAAAGVVRVGDMEHPGGAQSNVRVLGISAAEAGSAQRGPAVEAGMIHSGGRPSARLHVLHGTPVCVCGEQAVGGQQRRR